MSKYVCSVCGYIYDEAAGIPLSGIAPGTKWEDIPDDWVCPICGAGKAEFTIEQKKEQPSFSTTQEDISEETEVLRELSNAELSVLCSNLARGSEKQYKADAAESFRVLADYFWAKAEKSTANDFAAIAEISKQDDEINYASAKSAAQSASDRGALRALVWSEKANKILGSLLSRYQKEGTAFFENTKVYVCDICGFIYIGDAPPEICPVCKVPSLKILPIARRA